MLVTKLFAQVEIAESTNHETEELPGLRKIADNLSASLKSEAVLVDVPFAKFVFSVVMGTASTTFVG